MRQVARYKRLTCPEEILQETDDQEWSIQFRWRLATNAEPKVLIDTCFAWVLSVARHGTGTRLSPLRLEFMEPRSHSKTIERHFGCPFLCGAPRNAIVFRAADAQRLYPQRRASGRASMGATILLQSSTVLLQLFRISRPFHLDF